MVASAVSHGHPQRPRFTEGFTDGEKKKNTQKIPSGCHIDLEEKKLEKKKIINTLLFGGQLRHIYHNRYYTHYIIIVHVLTFIRDVARKFSAIVSRSL